MRDYLTLGPAPSDEPCAQVGSDNYDEQSRKECQVFIAQLRRQFGTEPILNRLSVKTFPHDFGSYREVVIYYDSDDQESVDYAFNMESELPNNWDKESLCHLKR